LHIVYDLPVNSALFGHYLTKKKPKSKNLKGKKKGRQGCC
jgi:hypothetical protein